MNTLMFSVSLFPEVDLLWSSAGLAPSRANSFPLGKLRGLAEDGSDEPIVSDFRFVTFPSAC